MRDNLNESVFAAPPTVCAVGDNYQIMIPVLKESLFWCEVGGELFYDDSNGILRSSVLVHRIVVPMKKLDAVKNYTIHYRIMQERLPYRSKTEPEKSFSFNFRPISPDTQSVRIYHLADTHSRIENPIRAASFWGDSLDLLLMNGDIPEDCSTLKNIASVYQISGHVSKGEIPVVFSRGNHDLRGVLAEKFAENTPSENGKTYYTFRLGPVWGIVLDCGEDKVDTNIEYGHTIACHSFRLQETEFLKKIAASPNSEYQAPGVRFRLVVVHNPFSETLPPPFDIEQDLFKQWCTVLREKIHPDLMVSGHIHALYVTRPGEPRDHKGQPCPVVVGSLPDFVKNSFSGAALEWTPDAVHVFFTDQDHKISGKDSIQLSR